MESDIRRFWEKTEVGGVDDCWEWKVGKDKDGYGQYWFKKRPTKAHRASWEIHYGKIPDGLWVLHHCDNPSCVNPRHLFLGTVLDNNRDTIRKNRKHDVRGELHGGVKLTESQVREIRKKYIPHEYSTAKLAREYSISQPHAWEIVSGRSWGWLR